MYFRCFSEQPPAAQHSRPQPCPPPPRAAVSRELAPTLRAATRSLTNSDCSCGAVADSSTTLRLSLTNAEAPTYGGGGGSRGRGLETSPQAAETEKHTGPGPELLPQTPTLARIVHGRALDTVGRVLPRVGIGPSPGCQPCIGMSRFKVRKRGSMQYNPSRVTSRKPMPNLHPHTSSHT